ncbi:MAG: iron-only hydrogenase system regulator [Clostridia bacterium]|jgi:putative iron-only hydrogenase system regulator|nr:iron-only hydrogenase system regulator [Clostridia bacterium]
MTNRVALLGIVVDDPDSAEALNKLLSEYRDFIVGRMGIPYRSRGINLISIVIDAPQDAISALTGKIGMLKGVTAKALYSKVGEA